MRVCSARRSELRRNREPVRKIRRDGRKRRQRRLTPAAQPTNIAVSIGVTMHDTIARRRAAKLIGATAAGAPELKPLGEVLSLFVKHGGKVIDSSPMYGNAEAVIGDLAAKSHLRNSLFIATKVWTKGKEEGIAQMGRSLERFQTRTIDLMQVHNLADVETQMD